MLLFWASFPKSPLSYPAIFPAHWSPTSPINHTKPMEIWLPTLIFSSIRWIHPQCLLNFENISCPLLDSCQKTFLPEIIESEAECRQFILLYEFRHANWHFWSVTHHVLSTYMNTPLSVYGLKGVISLSTIILDNFILLFIFILFHTLFYLWWRTSSITSSKTILQSEIFLFKFSPSVFLLA